MKIKAPGSLVAHSASGEVRARCTALFAEGNPLPRVWIEIGKRRVECLPNPPEPSRHTGLRKIAFTAEFRLGEGLKALHFCYQYHGQRKRGIGWRFIQVRYGEGHSAGAWSLAEQRIASQDVQRKQTELMAKLNEVSSRSKRLATCVQELLNHADIKSSEQTNATRQALESLLACLPQVRNTPPQGITAKGWNARLESIGWDFLKGWIHSASEPLTEGVLLASIDDQPMAATIVTKPDREDVVTAQSGGKALSFYIPASSSWFDNQQHKIELKQSIHGQTQLLATWFVTLKSPWDEVAAATRKPVILFVSHNLRTQGAQNSLFDLVTGLNARGKYKIIVHSPSDGAMRKWYEEAGLPVVIQPFPKATAHASAEQYDQSLARWATDIARIQPNVIVANTLTSYPAILLARKMSVPCLLIPRESEGPEVYFEGLPSYLKEQAKATVAEADRVVFVSNHTRAQWEAFNQRAHFDTIHNVLRPERLLNGTSPKTKTEARLAMGLQPDDLVFLSLGTVTERKGQLDFAQAFARLQHQSPRRVIGVIVGMNSNSYTVELRNLHSTMPEEVRERLLLLPETEISGDSVADYYGISDVFVMTSRLESYPRVVLEAMFFGLPIITTPVFGVQEQCQEGENALFYEPGAIDVLTEHLRRLAEDEALRKEMGEKSLALYAQFDTYPQLIDRYEAHIQALLATAKA